MPKAISPTFWEAIAKRIVLSEPERILLERREYEHDYARMPDDGQRREIVDEAARLIDDVRESMIEVLSPEDGSSRPDGRWPLLRDLAQARGFEPEVPFRISGHPWISLRDFRSGTRVTVEFDGRLSKDALCREIKRAWPTLRKQGLVQPSRPLGDRKLALLRFVCLESDLDESWRSRLERWNDTHSDMEYADLAAFQSDFSRAEKSLTGARYRLGWHYDPAMHQVIELDNRDDIRVLIESGEWGPDEASGLLKVIRAAMGERTQS